jgi:hypothetical protein
MLNISTVLIYTENEATKAQAVVVLWTIYTSQDSAYGAIIRYMRIEQETASNIITFLEVIFIFKFFYNWKRREFLLMYISQVDWVMLYIFLLLSVFLFFYANFVQNMFDAIPLLIASLPI